MPPKKNTKKMDLGSFLADESFGAWADEEVDMSSIGVPTSSTAAPISNYRPDFASQDSSRPDRVEYPVPDAPPYKARVGNLPYEVEEGALGRFFEDRLQAQGVVEEVKLPLDQMTGRPKGFAFITFTKREILEEALRLSMAEFDGRRIFVNVAAPQKADVFDMDWRSGRTGPMGGREPRERREEVDLDWGAARNSSAPVPARERGDRFDRGNRGEREFGERRPRREDPDLDWGAARTSAAPAPPAERERKPRREEPDLDWGSARSAAALPPRERDNFRRERDAAPRKDHPELDWSSARGTGTGTGAGSGAPYRKREEKEKEFDWKRGQALPPKASRKTEKSEKKEKKDDKEQQGPQKSVYSVLSLDADSDAEAESETKKTSEDVTESETGLEEKVAAVSVEDGEWETVKK